jgi:hypothetical protein
MLFLICENALPGGGFEGPPPIPVVDHDDLQNTAYFWRPNYQYFYGLHVPPGGPQERFALYLTKSRAGRVFEDYEAARHRRGQEDLRWRRYLSTPGQNS